MHLFLHNKLRDSFNIVLVFTDGYASDGACRIPGETCNKEKQKCFSTTRASSGMSCKLLVQAPKLKALPDRNATVTVVSVGFGNVNAPELKSISSGEDNENTIIAQGKDASEGLAALKKLLGTLVEKVCLNLPVDCVVTYNDWTPCPDECGQHYQFQTFKEIAVESQNGGKPCPTRKQRLKRNRKACKFIRECPPTTTGTSTTTTTTSSVVTTTSKTSAKTTTTTSPYTSLRTTKATTSKDSKTSKKVVVEDDNDEVDAAMANAFTWTLAAVCSVTILVV